MPSSLTQFEKQILLQVIALEEGEVVAYGTLASRAGRPGAARAVGSFLAKGKLDVPWWRVVRSDGRLHRAETLRQEALLAQEGVVIAGSKVVKSPLGDFAKP